MGCENMLPPFRHGSSLEDPLTLGDLPQMMSWGGKIAYLDRDGVLNKWKDDYVNSPEELELLPSSGKAIGSLRRMGFRICLVTNQSPIGRGIWGHETLAEIHDRLQSLLIKDDSDAELDLILYSPYMPEDSSWSRKPNPGMLEAGRQLLENAHKYPGKKTSLSFGDDWLDRPSELGSFLVGDRESDIFAADRFGVKGVICNSDSGIASVINEIISSRGGEIQ